MVKNIEITESKSIIFGKDLEKFKKHLNEVINFIKR